MTIHNDTDLPTVSASLPDGTTVFSDDCWDGNFSLSPGSSSGTSPTGYSV